MDSDKKRLLINGIIIGICIAVGVGIKYIVPGIKDDNVVEELAEKIIEHHTGIDIDLTPTSSQLLSIEIESL